MLDLIRKRLENGFEPFAVCLSDGRRFEVPHRDFIAVSQRILVIIDKDEIPVTISPLYITSVENLKPAS